jgi:hypothetical protein
MKFNKNIYKKLSSIIVSNRDFKKLNWDSIVPLKRLERETGIWDDVMFFCKEIKVFSFFYQKKNAILRCGLILSLTGIYFSLTNFPYVYQT